MRAKAIVIIVAVLLIGGGVAYLALSSDTKKAEEDMMARKTSTQETGEAAKESATDTKAAASTGGQGAYVNYSADIIAKTSGTKLIFFFAPWCPQCQALDADIKAKGVPGGVTIIKTDYDSNQALRQKYGVTIQTTVVAVDDNGNLVKKYVAYDDPTLSAVVNNLL